MMSCAVCPNCGLDLERFEEMQKGDIKLTPHEIFWRDRRVPLTMAQRLMVSAIVRADGVPISTNALAEIIETDESQDPRNVVAVLTCRIRHAFQDIDPDFRAIETIRGVGLRWAA